MSENSEEILNDTVAEKDTAAENDSTAEYGITSQT